MNSRGAREVCSSVDQTKNVKTKKEKKVFSTNISTNSGCRLKIPAIFDEFLSKVQKKKKKRSSTQKFYDIRCESTKVTKKQFLLVNFRALNNNLGVLDLDLHFSSPEPINFFGAQFSFGGHKQSFGGGTAPERLPLAPGLAQSVPLLRQKICQNSSICCCCCFFQIRNRYFRQSHPLQT